MGKVKITTWVDEKTAGTLRALAAQHEISMSEATAQTLKKALRDQAAEGVGAELLIPAVKNAVRREVAGMADRLANLMARSALESAAARRLALQLVAEEFGTEEAGERNRAAWKGSVESLKKSAEGVREIIGEAPSGASMKAQPEPDVRAGDRANDSQG